MVVECPGDTDHEERHGNGKVTAQRSAYLQNKASKAAQEICQLKFDDLSRY